ncbi:hypothetical protein ACJIZ3_004554 [Penstemon smallii]|uniref:Uncharacterized protein n=1 Tax=Penstemon smallii TaxID=265156 RepID=A0ABD3S2D3_9LAMI
MSQKRQQREEGTSYDDKRPKKFPDFKSVVRDVMNLHRLQNLMEPVLEPLIRRVVKEEVDSALRKYIISMKRNQGKDVHPSELRSLQLRFLNAISLPVFTGTRIEGEGCTTLEVALVDALTGQVISSGLGSSSKVEIVVLEGDFDGQSGDNWTLEEFTNNVMREREGKKPLLTGDMIMTLKDGKGLVGDVSFTDNSSWTRSRKFRLGARLTDNLGGIRVREARSEPFIVRDHRGELYKKHHPPSLSDEVWRLEKIGKDGAFHKRLSKERVNTVQDFLMLLFINPSKLRSILGSGMSAKMWEITVEHARTCVLDDKLYLYDPSRSLQKNGVVFNVVGQVIGMFTNGQYLPIDKLSEPEKANALELVISAFGDNENVVTFDNEASSDMMTPRINYGQQDASSSDYNMQSVYSVGGCDDYLHSVDPMEIFPGQISDICDSDSMAQAFCANEGLQYFERDCSLQSSSMEFSADLQDAINAFIPCSTTLHIDEEAPPKGWNVLVSVLKWCFSIKRSVRKTRAKEILLANI